MKLQTLLITTFALTLSFVNAEETTPVPPFQVELVPATPANGKDPYKDSTRVTPPPQVILSEKTEKTVPPGQGGVVTPQVGLRPFEPQSSATETLSFCYEDFSLPLEMMADIQQKQLTDAALYDYVRKSLGTDPKKDPVRRETFVILRTKPGFSANARNEAKIINPDSKHNSQVGYNINLDCDLSDAVNLRFYLTKTLVIDDLKALNEGKDSDKPLANIETINATVGLTLDTPCLLGTVNRAADSRPSSGSGDRILLGFVTANRVK